MKRLASAPETPATPQAGGRLHVLGFPGDDAALHAALVQGHPGAPAALFDRYGAHIQRVLANVLGMDDELPDLLHEVFARALRSVDQVQDGAKLKAWLCCVAVYTARGCIRARQRRRWLRFLSPEQMPEPLSPQASPEVREAMAATYALLAQMNADLRIVFALRFIQGMTLQEVADSCGTSLATCKRRLSKAEQRFVAQARRDPALVSWVQEGSRWQG